MPGTSKTRSLGHKDRRPALSQFRMFKSRAVHYSLGASSRLSLCKKERSNAIRVCGSSTSCGGPHVAEDGPTVFEHACRIGAEGIVSKPVEGAYRSGPCPVWIKVRNPASIAVQRERSQKWRG